MPLYTYKAVSPEGRMVFGRIDAINLVDLEMRLRRMELDLVSGEPVSNRSLLGSGSVPTGAQTAQLALLVGREVAPQTLEALKVKGSAGSQSQSASFRLVVAAPLPIGQVRPDLVQASGGVQRAGTLENAGMASEPVRAGTARDAGGLLEVRHGFLPSGKAQ